MKQVSMPKQDPVTELHDTGEHEPCMEAVINENYRKRYGFRFIKRTFDIAVSLFGLILCLIPFALIAIAVKCDSKGPIIFRQKRVGRNMSPFILYKFRSMSTSAPRECASQNLKNSESYITKVGGFLRKTSLDELPQLFNVLKGDMSFIGPRPCIFPETELIRERNQRGVFTVRPGLSGPSQIYDRNLADMEKKAQIDADYVNQASVWKDLKLMFQTVICVLQRKGFEKKSGK